MSLTITDSVGSQNIYNNLYKHQKAMNKSLEKLSSGYRINVASDGPADLVVSEKLRAQMEGLERAIRNISDRYALLSIADGALAEMHAVLRDMRQFAIHSLNSGVLSPEQIAADQAVLDASLSALDRIAETTNLAGHKILSSLQGIMGNKCGSGGLDQAGQPSAAGQIAQGDGGEGTRLSEESIAAGFDRSFLLVGALEEGTENLASDANAATWLRELRNAPETPEKNGETVESSPVIEGTDLRVFMAGDDVAEVGGMDDEEALAFLKERLSTISAAPQPVEARELTEAEKAETMHLENVRAIGGQLGSLSSATLGGVEWPNLNSAGELDVRTLTLNDLRSGQAASLANNPDLALQIMDQAMKDVLGIRAGIAAEQAYALQTTEDCLRTELENLAKVESFIRDADMAAAITEYARSQILFQATASLLAQKKLDRQWILKLLE